MFSIIPYRSNRNMATRENRGFFDDFSNDFFRSFFEDGFNGLMRSERPLKVDVRDEGDKFVLEADMPGMKREDVHVDVDNGILTISTEYNQENEEKKEEDNYVYRERRYGRMSRSFNVENIREEDITAEFKDGVLKLNLPKKENQPVPSNRRIEVLQG